MLIQLPFSGFYYSMHNHVIDQEIESIFSDDSGDTLPEFEALYSSIDQRGAWVQIRLDYALLWVDAVKEALKQWHGIALDSLSFESLTSPREYNFETDKIFCNISASDVATLRGLVPDDELAATIKRRCSHRSGFISHYSNDLEAWQAVPIVEWDHNELNILFNAVLESIGEELSPHDVMGDNSSNGRISALVEKHVPQSSWDIVNSHYKAA